MHRDLFARIQDFDNRTEQLLDKNTPLTIKRIANVKLFFGGGSTNYEVLVCDDLALSPLISLMKDKVVCLTSCNVSAVFLNEVAPREEAVVNGGVFGSPESSLNNIKWRKMARNSIYKNRVMAVAIDKAEVINHWCAHWCAQKFTSRFLKSILSSHTLNLDAIYQHKILLLILYAVYIRGHPGVVV